MACGYLQKCLCCALKGLLNYLAFFWLPLLAFAVRRVSVTLLASIKGIGVPCLCFFLFFGIKAGDLGWVPEDVLGHFSFIGRPRGKKGAKKAAKALRATGNSTMGKSQ